MEKSLVNNNELAEYLRLPITNCQLTALLDSWGILVADVIGMSDGSCIETFKIHPDFRHRDLGELLEYRGEYGDLERDWFWNERGRKVVLSLFEKLQFPDSRKIAKVIVRDELAAMAVDRAVSDTTTVPKFDREKFLVNIKNRPGRNKTADVIQ